MAEKRRIGSSRFISQKPPHGFGAVMYYSDDAGVSAHVIIDRDKEGPPHHVHGGALLTLIDEAMGAAAWCAGYRVLAVNLNVNYRRAVPIESRVEVRGRVLRRDGRKVFTEGELILADGEIAVHATGIFVDAPQIVGTEGWHPFNAIDDDGESA